MERKFRVGVNSDWEAVAADGFRQAAAQVFDPLPGLEYEYMEDRGNTAIPDVLNQYDAVVVFSHRFPTESFSGVKRLVCISRWGVGFDRIDVEASTATDVAVTLTPLGVRRHVAEGIIALIFALAKNIRRLDQNTRAGRWREGRLGEAVSIRGYTLGSVGVGGIAREMFQMAQSLGFARLLGHDPYVSTAQAAELGVELVDLDTVMRESDFLAVNTPLSKETRGLIGARELALMKPSAYLVNTCRGPVVDEAALIDVLQKQRIAGAGLDVFEQEPTPLDNPLLQLDNVVLTPHAIAITRECVWDISLEACENVRAVYEGRLPPFLANPEVVDRPGMQAKLVAWRKQ